MTPDELKAIRVALGFTQQQFATLLGIHRVTVNRYEAGATPISEPVARLAAMHEVAKNRSRRKQ
jgi:transcriptional regulator with XRE-family HTH domain